MQPSLSWSPGPCGICSLTCNGDGWPCPVRILTSLYRCARHMLQVSNVSNSSSTSVQAALHLYPICSCSGALCERWHPHAMLLCNRLISCLDTQQATVSAIQDPAIYHWYVSYTCCSQLLQGASGHDLAPCHAASTCRLACCSLQLPSNC